MPAFSFVPTPVDHAQSAQYWLFKSEPESFSILNLKAAPKQTTFWDGVRTTRLRNFLRDQIKPGDQVLFYHSAADPPAVVGTAVVTREGYPDHTAWQKTNHHFDPKSTKEKPLWYMVDIKLEEIFPAPLPLNFLREQKALAKMELLRRGSRLSIQPVTKSEFDTILTLAQRKARKEVAHAGF